EDLILKNVTAQKFATAYEDVFAGDRHWQSIQIPEDSAYQGSDKATYIKQPPFVLPEYSKKRGNLTGARILAIFGDSITTDHISPAGSIAKNSPAGKYLMENGIEPLDFNSYGSRRGNHEVMMRGTFANVRIKNRLANKEGG